MRGGEWRIKDVTGSGVFFNRGLGVIPQFLARRLSNSLLGYLLAEID